MASDLTTVLHVVNTLEGGGMERTVLALLGKFSEPRLRHVVVTLRDAGSLAARVPADVSCIPLGARRRSLATPLALARLVRRFSPAIVHARGVGCWLDATLAGAVARPTASVLGFHGWERTEPFSLRHRLAARLALAASARFTSVSMSGADLLHRDLSIPHCRINVLPNGVDLDRFGKVDGDGRIKKRLELGIPPDALVVATVGSLTPIKRHDVLLAATSVLKPHVPNLIVLIVGDGPLRQQLERESHDAGLGPVVHFLGQREDVPAILAAADLYVCASDSEGMSNAILEALASGLPVIATAVGENASIVRDQVEGIVVAPGSPPALAEALRAVALDAKWCRRLSTAARLRATEFNIDRPAALYEHFYAGIREWRGDALIKRSAARRERIVKYRRLDSNQGPSAPQADALTN